MVGSFSLFLKVCLFGSSSLCKADVAACRGGIRMKLREKSLFDLMQHLILKQWNAGTGFSQKKLTKDSVFCYLALTDRGNWNASWCRRLSFFGSIRSTLGLTDPLLHPKLSAFQISCKIIWFDLIGKCGDGWEGEVRLLKMWSSGRLGRLWKIGRAREKEGSFDTLAACIHPPSIFQSSKAHNVVENNHDSCHHCLPTLVFHHLPLPVMLAANSALDC